MSRFLRWGATVLFVVFPSSILHAEPAEYVQLRQQIEQLQARIAQLESRPLASPDVDATIERVLNDADRRGRLLQMEGFTAGWTRDKGFRIQDAQGNWVMHPNLQFQFRSTSNWRDREDGGGDVENGFELRRTKLGIDGNAFSPDLYYFFLFAVSSNGGSFNLEQAWVRYSFADAWALRAGQFTNPTIREQCVSSRRQLAVERSLVNQLVTGVNEAVTQAVSIIHDEKDCPMTFEIGVGDGFSTGNTNFVDPGAGGSTNWGTFIRANWFVFGDRKQSPDFSAMGNKSDLLVLGAGADVTQTGDSTQYLHTLDAQWENTNGLGVYGAFYGNWIDSSGDDDSTYDWGVLAQAGQMISERWEVFARYDYTRLDRDDSDSFNELTAGVNWYISGSHAAKIQFDLTWLPDGAPSDAAGMGVLQSDGDQVLLRGQFQLLI